MRYNPSDYLYASARIRALESHLVGRDKLNQLLEMSDANEIMNALAENGFPTDADPMTAPDAVLKAAFRVVAEAVPDKSILRFLQYPYDCHNLKTLIKCKEKGTDPAPLLVDLGSISTETLQTGNEKELFERLPTHLFAAREEAINAFRKTGDPREIDFILDRALYLDMAENARSVPFAATWVAAKADLCNLLICLRLMRTQGDELGRSTLCAAMLPGGLLPHEQLLQCFDDGEAQLFKLLSATPYAGIWQPEMDFSALEKQLENHLMRLVKQARSVIFGAEVPLAYLLAIEAQCKNIRILLAGKKARLAPDAIKERMRDCYV